MEIEKILIKNYKIYESLNLTVKNPNNILVGNNGSGKTTLLEAIYMALTGRLDGQPLDKEITANLFSNLIRKQYITKITLGEKPKLGPLSIK